MPDMPDKRLSKNARRRGGAKVNAAVSPYVLLDRSSSPSTYVYLPRLEEPQKSRPAKGKHIFQLEEIRISTHIEVKYSMRNLRGDYATSCTTKIVLRGENEISHKLTELAELIMRDIKEHVDVD